MSERPRRKNGGLESKAYYIVLLLCLAAVLIMGVYGPGYDASVFIYREF